MLTLCDLSLVQFPGMRSFRRAKEQNRVFMSRDRHHFLNLHVIQPSLSILSIQLEEISSMASSTGF